MGEIVLDARSYSLEAVKKCLYWYSDRYTFDIKNVDNQLIIGIEPITKDSTDEIDDELFREIKSDIIDFEVRQIVNNETEVVKQLLMAKAFATTDQYENSPPGDISDPVGFKP